MRLYLLAYNLASALGWAYLLYALSAHLLALPAPGTRAASTPATFKEDPLGVTSTLVERVLALLRDLLPFLRSAPQTVGEQIHEQLPDAARPLWARARMAFAAVGPATAVVQSGAALEVVHALLGWVRSPVFTTAVQVASRLFLVWGIADRFETVRPFPPPSYSHRAHALPAGAL